jgi:hypothetical protein
MHASTNALQPSVSFTKLHPSRRGQELNTTLQSDDEELITELQSACVHFKETGHWTDKLYSRLKQDFQGRNIMLLVPDDPYTGKEFSAPRQYARVLLEWAMAKQGDVSLSYSVVNETTQLPPMDSDTIFIFVGYMEPSEEGPGKGTVQPAVQVIQELIKRGSRTLLIHDSWCFDEGPELNPETMGSALGCPNLGPDIYSLEDRTYFTPWGSEVTHLFPEKTSDPSIFVDATRDWEVPKHWDNAGQKLSAKEFVEIVSKNFPKMKITVLGDESITTPADSSHFEHFTERLELETFQEYLRKSWFYATGIASSYELSLSDAAVAGALLIDVGMVSKSVVVPPDALRLCLDTKDLCPNATDADGTHQSKEEETVASMTNAINAYHEQNLAEKTAAWGKAFHSSSYVGLNLLCSIRADEVGTPHQWTTKMFPDTVELQKDRGPASESQL